MHFLDWNSHSFSSKLYLFSQGLVLTYMRCLKLLLFLNLFSSIQCRGLPRHHLEQTEQPGSILWRYKLFPIDTTGWLNKSYFDLRPAPPKLSLPGSTVRFFNEMGWLIHTPFRLIKGAFKRSPFGRKLWGILVVGFPWLCLWAFFPHLYISTPPFPKTNEYPLKIDTTGRWFHFLFRMIPC